MGLEGSLDDGFSWRKYGQKGILGAKYPRCAYYFHLGISNAEYLVQYKFFVTRVCIRNVREKLKTYHNTNHLSSS